MPRKTVNPIPDFDRPISIGPLGLEGLKQLLFAKLDHIQGQLNECEDYEESTYFHQEVETLSLVLCELTGRNYCEICGAPEALEGEEYTQVHIHPTCISEWSCTNPECPKGGRCGGRCLAQFWPTRA